MSEFAFANKAGYLNVNIEYVTKVEQVTLTKHDSLLVVGKARDLKRVQSQHLNSALKQLEIPENWFDESIAYLSPAKKDKTGAEEADDGLSKAATLSWLNKLFIHKLTNKCSRNNTPSRSHLITKWVRQHTIGNNQLIVIACSSKNRLASACAVARAYPIFSAKTDEKAKERSVYVTFLYTDEPSSLGKPNEDDVKSFKYLADSIRLSAKIVDIPCSAMNTDDFLAEIKVVAKELGIEPYVVEGEALRERGFGGIYHVGKAAEKPPKLVVLSHLSSKAKRTVAWVGKGIVFDTGGLCIKSRPGMCGMKADCGGAAGVLGAFYAAVKLGFEDNLHAIFCLAENAVGPNAYRPDDIITLYSGKTVEITNTDAEGRLVLGDGVAYASKDLKADIIVDMATLTGAQGAATGKYHCALLTNNEKWEDAGVEAGKICGDLAFPIVFAPELHFSEFNSEVADMRNSVIKADNAASACAGLFVHSHLNPKFDGIWVHLDIASPISDSNDRCTGFGVVLLNTMFADSITNSTVRSYEVKQKLPIKNTSNDTDSQAED